MVREDPHGVLCTKEKGASTFKPEDDSGRFSVVDVIIALCWEEAAGVKGDGMHSIVMLLGDNDAEHVSRGIGVYNKWL